MVYRRYYELDHGSVLEDVVQDKRVVPNPSVFAVQLEILLPEDGARLLARDQEPTVPKAAGRGLVFRGRAHYVLADPAEYTVRADDGVELVRRTIPENGFQSAVVSDVDFSELQIRVQNLPGQRRQELAEKRGAVDYDCGVPGACDVEKERARVWS